MIKVDGPLFLIYSNPELALRALNIQRAWEARQLYFATLNTVVGWPNAPASDDRGNIGLTYHGR